MAMTLRRHIAISNVLMIALPIAATTIVGLLCAVAIYHSTFAGPGFDDDANFEEATFGASVLAEDGLRSNKLERFRGLEDLASKTNMEVSLIDHNTKEVVFEHHDGPSSKDEALTRSVRALGDGSFVKKDGRIASYTIITVSSKDYELITIAWIHSTAHHTQMRAYIAISLLVVLAVVFSSAFLSSRFLSRRLVARFKQPLAELEGGLRALRSGKLSSRLNPPRDREFEQAFRDFNDMAATLESISARQQRQEANRRRLLADIAHDVRSPLTSIRGYAEGLLDGIASTPERQQRYLSTIKDKAEQISELIDDLFELSKLDLDDRPLDLVPTRVDREIQEVVDHFQPDTGANLLFNLKLTPCTALIDQRLFRRALQNILQNSAKYGNKDQIQVTVSLQVKGGFCHLVLTDDGPGVSAEDAIRIFEPFYRTDKARKDPHTGSGIGLAFVKRAMTAMNGNAQAHPSSEHGLTIELTIPLVSENS